MYTISTIDSLGIKTIKTVCSKSLLNMKAVVAKMTSSRILFNKTTESYCPIKVLDDLVILPRFAYHTITSVHPEITLTNNVVFNNADIDFGTNITDIWQTNKDIINAVANKMLTSNNVAASTGVIVKLDTGSGKTVIIAELIRLIGKRTVIFVKNGDLQKQMYDDISASLSDARIALIGGRMKQLVPTNETNITICIINSGRKIKDWSAFGFAIFDECHTYCSDENSNIFNYCQLEYMLGTSANPDKTWNYKLLEYNIGPIIDYNTYCPKKAIDGVVHIINYKGPPEHTQVLTSKHGILSIAKMVKQFMDDPIRNELIIEQILNAVAEHGNGFVFAMRNDFLDMLAKMLAETYPMIKYAILYSKSSIVDREYAYANANVVFTNYAFSEGINIPRMKFIIHASPYKDNGRQITGRVLRGELSELRAIYDIVDIATPLKRQFETRKQIYLDRGYRLVIA